MQLYEYSKILEQQVQQKSKLRWMSAMHQKDCCLKKENQNQTIERNCVMEAFPSVLGFKQLLMVPSLGSRKTCLMLLAETARFSVVDFSMLLIKKTKMDHFYCNFAIVFDHLGEFKPVTQKKIYHSQQLDHPFKV